MAKADVVIESPAEAVVTALNNLDTSGDLISDLFDRAYAVEEAKEKVFEIRNGIRESLRNLATAGMLSEEQRAELSEVYPPRERKSKDEDEDGSEDDSVKSEDDAPTGDE